MTSIKKNTFYIQYFCFATSYLLLNLSVVTVSGKPIFDI